VANKNYLIPLIENGEIIDTVTFKDNLTREDKPDYVNFNGRVGLTRCNSERNKDKLVIMYFYPDKQEDSYAEFISEADAFNMCRHRNKLDTAYDLKLRICKEREVL